MTKNSGWRTAGTILSLLLAFWLGQWLGKDQGKTEMILEDMDRDRAVQGYADCILLRGKEACAAPPELANYSG